MRFFIEPMFLKSVLSFIPPFALLAFVSIVASHPDIDQGPHGFLIAVWAGVLLFVGTFGGTFAIYQWSETIRFVKRVITPTPRSKW